MVRKTIQVVSASQACRQRILDAKKDLPQSIGQQDVINWVVKQCPDLDRLTYASRWRNAWLGRVADPEITQLVEQAVQYFKEKAKPVNSRLRRQKLNGSRSKSSTTV